VITLFEGTKKMAKAGRAALYFLSLVWRLRKIKNPKNPVNPV